ncbi:hypothetical protein B0J12DRAFT_701779 [Macrophomina phaseolina]|uniref:Uncharacterized protein n=1 Tax=Macrophomina phaseolina TaxID=35725 RepID=A0ABQ8G450_9PEZI|nr:hypothetical protein B0J12DRAFT_701779 [Macrophomina phaseolina]
MTFVILLYDLISWLVNRNKEDSQFRIPDTGPGATLIALLIEQITISKSFGDNNNYKIDLRRRSSLLGSPTSSHHFWEAIRLQAHSHVLLDIVTPPAVLYRFWKASSFEILLVFVGTSITISTKIENGVYAVVAASAAALLLRQARASGIFPGYVEISYMTQSDIQTRSKRTTKAASDIVSHFDGSNSSVTIRCPSPEIFICKFAAETANVNQAHYFASLGDTILTATRPTIHCSYKGSGERRSKILACTEASHNWTPSACTTPVFRAVSSGSSAVSYTDVTAVQGLIDVRNQLDRHTSPETGRIVILCYRQMLDKACFGCWWLRLPN